MAYITPERIGELIAEAPAWAKVALTMPNESLRADGCATLAQHVYDALYQPVNTDMNQLALPL